VGNVASCSSKVMQPTIESVANIPNTPKRLLLEIFIFSSSVAIYEYFIFIRGDAKHADRG
jgi:hypothetical protein